MRIVASQVNDGVAFVDSSNASLRRRDRNPNGACGSFKTNAAAAAAGMGSTTIPERLTSYQLSLEEKVTVADDASKLAVRLKVTTPPAARRLFKQVVTPGTVVFKPTVGAAPQLGISKSKGWDPRKVRTGGRMLPGVPVGIEK